MFRTWKPCRSVTLFFQKFTAPYLLQKYSNALSQSNSMNQDTIHYLFPNLNKLLNFQRKFLIRLESTAELPWQDQRWGLHFIENVSQIRPFILISTDFGTPVVVLYTPLFFLHSFPLSHSDLLQE